MEYAVGKTTVTTPITTVLTLQKANNSQLHTVDIQVLVVVKIQIQQINNIYMRFKKECGH